ncbi:MAG TPA: twin-arginine translocase TatA/TatE family subunit [Actinomycetota bacterium]|nr:twin-arginine translocase TatA/TatE family subunit [Actinomycetota bacterium]
MSFGPTELLILLGIVLLLFGARKLPELARSMGSSLREFRKGMHEEPSGRDKEGQETA